MDIETPTGDGKKEIIANPQRIMAFEGDAQDPLPVYILTNEEIVLRRPAQVIVPSLIMPEEALLRITQASSVKDIGEHTVLASVNTVENAGNRDLELYGTEGTVFGRDSERVALDMLPKFPAVAMTTIKFLAATQGVVSDSLSEEEPGRIIHEYRRPDDPVGQEISENIGWKFPYYGSVDATLGYINLVSSYIQQEGNDILDEKYVNKKDKKQSIRDSVVEALIWAVGRMDRGTDGLVEFYQQSPHGIENQDVRDAREAFHHKDSTMADNTYGIASIGIQVEAYKAFQAAAKMFPEKRDEYLTRVNHLRDKILNEFWVEDEEGGYFALGSERKANGARELLKIRTSDMGRVLNSDILEGDDPEIVRKKNMLVATLTSDNMMGASGIRSLGKDELRYCPRGYWTGRIWSLSNGEIAAGFERYGFLDEAYDLHQRNANIWRKTGIFPESVDGDSNEVSLGERIVDIEDKNKKYKFRQEQPPQLVQAWSVTSIILSLAYLDRVKTVEKTKIEENSIT